MLRVNATEVAAIPNLAAFWKCRGFIIGSPSLGVQVPTAHMECMSGLSSDARKVNDSWGVKFRHRSKMARKSSPETFFSPPPPPTSLRGGPTAGLPVLCEDLAQGVPQRRTHVPEDLGVVASAPSEARTFFSPWSLVRPGVPGVR